MSLVGTRPPTVDEWDKYELHHRARLATKPGLTGMWQVSGRSNITDFEEVVKLDKQYISEWTMGLDIKILCGRKSCVCNCYIKRGCVTQDGVKINRGFFHNIPITKVCTYIIVPCTSGKNVCL